MDRIAPLNPNSLGQSPASHQTKTSEADFNVVLQQANIRFSQHAQTRLKSDKVSLTTGDLDRIGGAMDKAADKGAKESLLLMEDKAFIVNARDRVVITSINRDRLKDNVFTQIDSAVII